MVETETTKKPRNKFTDIIKAVAAAAAGGVTSGEVGPIILWGGGLAAATAIAAYSIKISNKKKKKKKQSPGKTEGGFRKKGSRAMITDIEEECINGFRLALHNPSQSLHHNAWSPLSLSKMKIQGQEIVSTRYLITEDKIVLQVEWREENSSASSKEEIVLFDSQKRAKITSSADDESSVMQMLSVSADEYAGKDPLGAIIQSIKNNPKSLEQMVNAKQEQGGGREETLEGQITEQIEESAMEEKKRMKKKKKSCDEEMGEERSAFISKEMGTATMSGVQQTVYDMRMQIWVFLVVVVVLILFVSPKLLTY
ncbi:hypothetical protein V2J09_016089 [Rumex salicifolius]